MVIQNLIAIKYDLRFEREYDIRDTNLGSILVACFWFYGRMCKNIGAMILHSFYYIMDENLIYLLQKQLCYDNMKRSRLLNL